MRVRPLRTVMRPKSELGKVQSPSKQDYLPGLYVVCTAGLIVGLGGFLSWLSGSPHMPWRPAEQPLIVSMRAVLEEVVMEAGLTIERERCSSISKYLSDGQYLMRYRCPVPETSRPALRAALVKRGWQPETNLNGRMFKLRREGSTASLYCPFNEKLCELVLETRPLPASMQE